ncbi:TlyA family RNA methyltransferase [Mesorhizobium sp. VK23B]|uniref:TlyA family RNA methyltransferase n=1 Tax=Mesorhizobium dulcispinae TaxID=3072316 RepID=A0ABU4XM20_9HYPH|nr:MULTISPECIES: TlyA family RNA methyltransferase [unclassified Mesorhizobium]MDX8469450.1 TlyA family RNA methyltransferase [Mesorhizobium sp. VK23B]MDX8475789.1 TlyA family RNA methyltransferase [Mesorhizobium sp. VK23A]
MSSPLPSSARRRLDELLVERGLFASRSRARDAIERGTVTIDGAVARKPGQSVASDCVVAIDDPAQAYVSRAALKLIAGLDHFGLAPSESEALDIGASTGGFTQVLLERGAAHVTAIDVGHGQMHPDIAADPRVTVIEGLNARDLTSADLGGRVPDFLVCDVSFISLKLALPAALALAGEGASALLLVKPQFEAGREAIGKGGLLKDPGDAERIAAALRDWLAGMQGWRVLGLHPSPIEGGDGNREFLLAAIKDAKPR